MFGYVTAYEPEMKVKEFHKYKGYYCGLCQQLKRNYGHLGQLTLTYDMTFLIIILTSLYEKEPDVTRGRCKVHPKGRELGIQAGANVVMPNLSPVSVRKDYSLYDNKICTGDEAAECRFCLERRMQSIGYNIVTSRGDSLNI